MNDALLARLDAIINEAVAATEEMDPDGDEAQYLWEPLQHIGYAVDQVKNIRRGDRMERSNDVPALPPAGGR